MTRKEESMFKKQTGNTRKYKRLLADYLIKYRIAGAEDQDFLVSNIKDISATGARFWAETPFQEGVPLAVEVMVPPVGRAIKALARVERVRPAGNGNVYYVAVQFVEISENDQSALNYFIERLASERGARVLVPDPTSVTRRDSARFF